MPVIGAVLHLDTDLKKREQALGYLSTHPNLTLGQEVEGRLAVVLDTDSRSQDKALWDEVQAQSGVLFCSVVFADFSDLTLEEIA